MIRSLILILIVFKFSYVNGENKDVSFTLEDRDRLIKTEVKVEEGFKSINEKFASIESKFESKFESIQKQIDFTNNLILTMLASMVGTIVYMWWDRRSANAPLKDSIEDEKKKVNQLIKVLKEYSDSHPELKTLIDRAAIL